MACDEGQKRVARHVGENTLAHRLSAEIATLTRASAAALPDDQMNHHLEEIFSTVTRLAHARVLSAADIDLKLSVLCRRLREDINPDDRARDDCQLLIEQC